MSRKSVPGKGSCLYSHFDRETFEPLNEETRLRLLEANFQKADFEGRTVLDIGCNTGLLSIEALAKGAASVKAIDVQPKLVKDLGKLIEQKQLAMTVERKAFHRLKEKEDRADIVLFFEVIHWLVSQGRTIREVIAKLAGLTGEKLFMEFPWSIREPSIEVQTKLGVEDYDASLILDELNKHFETVKIERFMHYFGYGGRSVRVLVTAEGRKISGCLLPFIPDLTGFEHAFAWGRDRSRYVRGQKNEYLVKRIAPESRLRLLKPKELTELFNELASSEIQILSLPLKLGQAYVVDVWGEEGMAFEWLGEPLRPVAPHWKISIAEQVDVACQVVRQMNHLKPKAIAALRTSKFFAPLIPRELKARFMEISVHHNLPLQSILPWVKIAQTLEPSDYSHLAHGDLNTSNILRLADGSLRVVDLDNACLGSPFLDVLHVLTMRGCSFEEMTQYLSVAQTNMGDLWPPLHPRHVVFPIYVATGWLYSVLSKQGEDLSGSMRRQVNRVLKGYQSLLQLGQSLAPAS